jgi:hypothetical protein
MIIENINVGLRTLPPALHAPALRYWVPSMTWATS